MPKIPSPLATHSELEQFVSDIAEQYHAELDKDRAAADARSLKFGYPRSRTKLKPAQQADMFQPVPENGRLF